MYVILYADDIQLCVVEWTLTRKASLMKMNPYLCGVKMSGLTAAELEDEKLISPCCCSQTRQMSRLDLHQ